jgi:L-lactate dehydrogenase complex protein LldE
VKIALFVTCLADVLYPNVGRATVSVLERLGHTVTFPLEQTCCGQMHTNTGYEKDAGALISHHVDVFERALRDGADAIVAPSGSCVGSVRHQHAVVARDLGLEVLARRAERVAERSFELSELLVGQLGQADVGAYFPHRVTYHPTCHSLRLLRVGDAPLALLRNVEAIELVDLPRADECCGFGGTFAIKNADTSSAILNDKISAVEGAAPDYVTAGDSSCLMQIGGGLSRRHSAVRPIHLAEILASTREPASRR